MKKFSVISLFIILLISVSTGCGKGDNLSEEKRKEVYVKLYIAEINVDKEANKKFNINAKKVSIDTIKKHNVLREQLLNKQNDEIAKQYSLTEKMITDISVEGITKKWHKGLEEKYAK